MAQVKKEEVRQAILDGARDLFRRRGYQRTTTAQIAAAAGVSESNLYAYFRSKLEIWFGIYEPWLKNRVGRLEKRIAAEPAPGRRIRMLLAFLWQDLPAADNGFTSNLTQALSGARRGEGYRTDLLEWFEGRIAALMLDNLPPRRRAALARRGLGEFAHLFVMAHDGFSLSRHLIVSRRASDAVIDLMAELLLGRR